MAARDLGRVLRAARLRRRMSKTAVINLALISQQTLDRVEQGDPTVSFGAYAVVLHAVGLGSAMVLLTDDNG
ncbi:MAG: helix-turn-helix domain-containing protein [Azospirillaceae bacterium]|nr:helix-turn-helix domain-containing protein [Azospirillaceae bacterium]